MYLEYIALYPLICGHRQMTVLLVVKLYGEVLQRRQLAARLSKNAARISLLPQIVLFVTVNC